MPRSELAREKERRVKVVHVFSNYKWTGPAEPAVSLCAALQRRGLNVTFVLGEAKSDGADSVSVQAERAGLRVRRGLYLTKHVRFLRNWRDARRLRAWLRQGEWDLIHTHLPNDHLVAATARRGAGRAIPIVRSSYCGDGMDDGWRTRWLLRRATDALIEPSHLASEADQERFGYPAEKMAIVSPAVDLERFNPDRPLEDFRPRLGLGTKDVVFGIVARMQTHRRFDVLLEATRRAAARVPRLRLVIVGRGTHQKAVARAPVRTMGLENVVRFAGYLCSDDFVAGLRALDAKVFLVPGSDGTCRAVREAMAMGKPVLAAKRGILPELVQDGVRGVVVNDTPENLAVAMERLALDAGLRAKLGRAAREYAVRELSPEKQADTVEAVYEECLRRCEERPA